MLWTHGPKRDLCKMGEQEREFQKFDLLLQDKYYLGRNILVDCDYDFRRKMAKSWMMS